MNGKVDERICDQLQNIAPYNCRKREYLQGVSDLPLKRKERVKRSQNATHANLYGAYLSVMTLVLKGGYTE